MRWLSKQPPGTVVISELNSFYQYDQYKQTAFGLHSDVLTTNAAERIRILDEGLISTVQTLEKTGHSVLLVQAAPDFEYPEPFSPLRCSLFDLRADACMARLPRTVADAIQQVQRSSLQKIAAETGANLWDPRDFFCSWDECSTQGHGIDLYRDAFHISADASHMLAPSLAAAIQLSG
jgi:hypothetical protein